MIGAVDRSYGSELGSCGSELWIGIDREGELIQRERESLNRKNEKEKWFRERERERALSDR